MVKSFSVGVSSSGSFSGLSARPWQARKYSVRRDGSDWTQVGMIISGNRIRPWSADMPARSRGATRPSCTWLACPLRDERAQGRPGARCTRGLVCNVHKEVRTRAYRSSGEHPAFPAQWLYGLCRALPGDEFLLPPSLCELTANPNPVGSNASAKLDTSHGRQDHTVLPYATTPLVLRGSIAHSPKTKLKAALQCLSRATLSRPPQPALHVS